MQNKPGRDKRFVCAKLPWVIAAVALVLYLATLNHWMSFDNLTPAAKAGGWLFSPDLLNPLFVLLTFPIRWFPPGWIPLAFNLFSAGCAVLTLALLARSVSLLPHDRTEAQRLREHSRTSLLSTPTAWIPPVLAAAVCGMQYTFWEKATGGSADMLDLLLFAYAIRCLLEYRISDRDSWLWQSALVWAIGMANHWVMLCLLPFYLIALVWIKGFAFFNLRFLFRMFLCAALGTLLYLLLPIVQALSRSHIVTFWQALRYNLATEKNVFMLFVRQVPGTVLLMLSLTSLLPVLVIGIRWASNFGDPSRLGSALSRWVFHIANAAFLIAGVWVAFDPTFSPRYRGYAILALYYLGALGVGYFAGYFLLVFNPLPERLGRTGPVGIWLNRFSKAAVVFLLIVTPVGLICRNLPEIRMTNGKAIKEYTFQLLRNLPDHGVILSDDSRKLILVQAALAPIGKESDFIFLDTQMLSWLPYHALQHRLHPDNWPAFIPTNPKTKDVVETKVIYSLVTRLSQTQPVCYLHPSFGYYFEYFDQRQKGLVSELSPYPTNSISGPPLSDEEIAGNEEFWNAVTPAMDHLASFISPSPVSSNTVSQPLLDMFHIPFEANTTAELLGQFYSRNLNFWAVQLQRAGRLDEARQRLRMALALNPDNIAAQFNLDLNRDLHAHRPQKIKPPKSAEEEMGKFHDWEQLLNETGPFDDATHCFGIGVAFAQSRLFRQAAQQLARVHELVPDDFSVRLWLARLYTYNRLPEQALSLIQNVPIPEEVLAETGIRKLDLLQTEATALFAANKPAEAANLLESTLQKDPGNTNLLSLVVQISTAFNQFTNALSAMDRLLEINPRDTATLMAKALLDIKMENHKDAIAPLTQVLSVQSNNFSALTLRAIAYLGAEQLENARKDYERLQTLFPVSSEVNMGLGEIAWREKNTNAAIKYYRLCLATTPQNSEQAKFLSDRLKSLQPGSQPGSP